MEAEYPEACFGLRAGKYEACNDERRLILLIIGCMRSLFVGFSKTIRACPKPSCRSYIDAFATGREIENFRSAFH